jgi:hypothetical protein
MKILIHDHGLCLEAAITLARAGHKVGYYTTALDKHSLHDEHLFGRGFDKEGVQKVDSFYSLLDSVDLICDFDTHNGDEVDWLRSKGHKVWGAGARAEKLELDRWHTAKLQQAAGLPTPKIRAIQGVTTLIKVLEHDYTNVELWIKCSGFREIETFHHESWPTTQEQFIAPLLTAYGTDPTLEFLLVDPIDPAQEVGADPIYLDGQLTTLKPYGYEDKDSSYIGRFNSSVLPTPLQAIFDAFAEELRSCTSFVSSEARVTSDRKGYLVDLTIRAPHPVMMAQIEAIKNFADVVTKHAQPTTRANYAAVLCGTSGWATEHSMEVTFPPKFRQQVKFAKAWRKDDHIYTVPSKNFAVQCVGLGTTIDQAIQGATMVANQVKGKELTFDNSSLDKLRDEVIPQGRKYGIEF